MRDLILFAIVFGLLPFIIKRPVIGVLGFTWISLMNPHRLTYGAAYDFPFAAILAAVTLTSLLFSKDPKRFPLTSATIVLILFVVWMNITTLFAQETDLAWREWDRVMKTFFMTFVAISVVNSEKDIKAYAWVLALSLGFYGFKGGLFTLLGGGTSHVVGPSYTYIGDNNALALALVTILPLIWYLRLQANNKWLRTSMTGLVLLTGMAIVGSYSRGALLAGGAMLFFLWVKSAHKLRTGLAVLLIVPLIFIVMPDKWFARMETIDNYKEDASAMGRINSWKFAANVAKDNLTAGGYRVFTPKMFMVYAPNPLIFYDAHSIYFQVLGEHGFIGLLLFLSMMFFAWRTGKRVLVASKSRDDAKWIADLAAMCQVSIIGYAVAGAFLTLAYYDLYYSIIVLLVSLEKLALKSPQQNTLPDVRSKAKKFQDDPNPAV
ncbi:MAG TPA: putative O-glycosylation ligase, exosortase A system-associated [Oxalobacteraceae bacterium]|nr:putative O-glycosylation ligase, exosortase A system-associated [Oxalobacteraceae bacterium]